MKAPTNKLFTLVLAAILFLCCYYSDYPMLYAPTVGAAILPPLGAFLFLVLLLRISDLSVPESIRLDGIASGLCFFALSLVLSAIWNYKTNGENVLWSSVVLAPAFYLIFKPIPDSIVHWAAFLALLVLSPIGLQHMNLNIFALSVLGLTVLALPLFGKWGFGILVAVSMIIFKICAFPTAFISLGLSVYLRFLAKRFSWIFALALATIVLVLASMFATSNTLLYRVDLAEISWQRFLTSPLIGTGPGLFYMMPYRGKFFTEAHAHNLIFNCMAEGGILGLAALFYLGSQIRKRWYSLPLSSKEAILLLLSFSIFDYPFVWWGCIMIFILAVSRNPSSEPNSSTR